MPMINTLRNRLVDTWNHSEDDALKRVIHFDIQKTDELINGDWAEETKAKYADNNHQSVVENGLLGLTGNKHVNLIIGGPPCQAYSIAGRAQDKDSMKLDYRNYLFESFVRVVNAYRPEAFVFENVPGLLSAAPGNIPVPRRIYEAFQEIGYEIRNPEKLKRSVYTASDLGVPQKRNRVIIVGVRKDSKFSLEEIYHQIDLQKGKVKKRDVRDAIAHLPALYPVQKSYKLNGKNISHTLNGGTPVKYHEPRYHNERDIAVFKKWLNGNMNNISSDERIAFYNDMMGKSSNHGKYRNLEWDKPSPTVVAHLYKDGLMFIHPDVKQARSITVKEAALLQSFPDNFDFIGSNGDCFKMIGNAVPPEMAKNIALGISNYIDNNSKEDK
jgi:DNA (cytosine-5)-methyltransferase 1